MLVRISLPLKETNFRMKRGEAMTRILAILLFMAIAVSACTTNSSVPEAAPETQAQSAVVVKTDFVSTDPKSVNLAAGKPQLVEFFAFW